MGISLIEFPIGLELSQINATSTLMERLERETMNLLTCSTTWRLLLASWIGGLLVCLTSATTSAQQFDPPSNSGFEIPADPPTDAPVAELSVKATTPINGARRLTDIVRSGGPLMIPIGICSFILVVFVFERFISLRKGRIIPGPFSKRFLEQLRDGELNRDSAITICDRNGSPMAGVFKAGILKWGRPAVEVEQAVLDEGERTSNRLRKYLRMLNGVATICPLLGLLGTVLGMIQAFDSIANAASTVTDQRALTATGISQALITTAAGMGVAIPALIAYLYFSSRVEKHVMEIDSLGMKVVNQISAESLQPDTTSRRRAA